MKRDPRYNGRSKLLQSRKNNKKKQVRDTRFDEAFESNSKFNQGKNVTTDRTGKKLEKTQLEQMKDFHNKNDDFSDSDSETENQEKSSKSDTKSDGKTDATIDATIESEPKRFDAARGELNSDASSSSEEEPDPDVVESEGEWDEVTDRFYHETAAKQHEIEGATTRLAFVNMDWTKVTARDVYILADSFKLAGTSIKSVKIYRSEAGKKAATENNSVLKNDDEGEDFSREALREWELSKLRWFYAIVETDCEKTAEMVSEQIDGREYMSSSAMVDVSFVPEDTEFSDAPEDEYDGTEKTKATEKEYHPLQLNHSSLSHTACTSTFDENDPRRNEGFGKAFEMFNDDKFNVESINMADYNDLVASASSDDDEAAKVGKKDLWKSLIQELDQEKEEEGGVHKQMMFDLDSTDDEKDENDGNGDKQVEPGMYSLDSSEEDKSGDSNDEESEVEEEEVDTDEELNKKAQLEMMMDGNDSEKNETDSEAEEKEETPEINTKDDRFSALFDTNKYSIAIGKNDKLTSGMQDLATEQAKRKMKKRKADEEKLASKSTKNVESEEDTNDLVARLKKKARKTKK